MQLIPLYKNQLIQSKFIQIETFQIALQSHNVK